MLALGAGCSNVLPERVGVADGGVGAGSGGVGLGGVGVGPAASGAVAPSASDAGTGSSTAEACAGASVIAPPARIWRLSSVQYVNTVKELFGADVPLEALPDEGVSEDGVTHFDTNADKALVNDRLASVYGTQAADIAKQAVSDVAGTADACVLDASADSTCVGRFLTGLGGRAYRRTLEEGEVARMRLFFEKARTAYGPLDATRMMIEAVLQSPHFVYRTELGPASAGAGEVTLTPHEVASELAYFLTDAPPDRELLDRAAAGPLAAATTQAQARRLVWSDAARAKLQRFFSSYLDLENAASKSKSPALFPEYGEQLRQDLRTETLTFVDKTLFEEKLSFDSLFSASFSYQNQVVAAHYGAAAPSAAFERVALPPGRNGLLSHAAVLAALSTDTTSPVHRGVFYLQTLLCRTLPVPPANAISMADKLRDPNNPTGTQREMYEYFQGAAPACAGCHTTFQPMGLSLENFDAIGRYRSTEFDKPIDPSVVVSGVAEDIDGSYGDGLKLSAAIAASREGKQCFTLQYATYALGRTIDRQQDACWLARTTDAFQASESSVQELLVAMASDPSFIQRTHE